MFKLYSGNSYRYSSIPSKSNDTFHTKLKLCTFIPKVSSDINANPMYHVVYELDARLNSEYLHNLTLKFLSTGTHIPLGLIDYFDLDKLLRTPELKQLRNQIYQSNETI